MNHELYQSILCDMAELARREAGASGKLNISAETKALLDRIGPPTSVPVPTPANATESSRHEVLRESSAPAPAPAAAPTTPAPDDALSCIADEVERCEKCPLWRTRTHTVPGEGSPHADLVFVGEAPGASEDRTGRPFVGRAGQLLTDIIIKGMRMKRTDVFICNVLKCRPPDNRTPNPEEVTQCEPYLLRQLSAIRPKAICALGAVAAGTLLKTKAPIKQLRGHWHNYHDIPLRVTYHPAYLLRNPEDKKKAWEDIQEVMALLSGKITLE